MPGQRNDPSQNNNDQMGYIVGGVVVCGIVVGLWFLFKQPIVYAVFALRWAELKPAAILGIVRDETTLSALDAMEGVFKGRYRASDIPFPVFWNVNVAAGDVARWFVVPAIVAMAVVVRMYMKGQGMTRKHDLGSFARYQASPGGFGTFLQSAHFDPNKASDNMAQARRPTDWINDKKIRLNRDAGGLDVEAVGRELESQLGPRWRGSEEPDLKLHVKVLVAIFGLHLKGGKVKRGHQNLPASRALMEDVSDAYHALKGPARDQRLASLVAPHLADAKVMGPVETFMGKHRFVNTALYRLLTEARKKRGVLATAEFLWLKDVDRDLWYGLNNCGRRAFHVEGAGIVSHYQYEHVNGGPSNEPRVGEAVEGVMTYLDDHHLSGMEDIGLFIKREKKLPE